MVTLPIDSHIKAIVDQLRRSRAVVVTAQPGAGKTTRVPPALIDDGPVILLQPRRVAARAVAQRIAEERGWTIGREVGWQVRFERRFTSGTRLLVVTEGVLTARLQRDPLLSGFRTIVLDEFHERSIHADLGIALAKQAWRARDDLQIVVMSATMDAAPVSAFFGGCPVVDVPGRLFPIEIRYAPQESVAVAAIHALATSSGDVLCFLPGVAEIRRAIGELESQVRRGTVAVIPLHGALDAAAQDAALRPSPAHRRIVVATNLAETSVTVPGVTAVVDAGWHKVARYDAERGIDSLDAERITADSADQRAGRSGRLAPGIVWRLWEARDRLRPHREPEIHRVDLSAAVLDIVAWGGDPRTFEWFERPRQEAIDAAVALLDRLGALRQGRLTELGDRIRDLPLHPRLARMLIAAGGAPEMARACALLAERHYLPARSEATTSDLLSALDDWQAMPAHLQRVAHEIRQRFEKGVGSLFEATPGSSQRRNSPVRAESINHSRPLFSLSESDFRRAILTGYPDRVAQRRDPSSPRVRLASGSGAVIGSESGVHDGEFLVALDVVWHAGKSGSHASAPADARIRLASRVERAWLEPNQSEIVHRFDPDGGTVHAARIDRYDALMLGEHPTRPDPATAAILLADAWKRRGPRPADEQLLRRLAFAGRSADVDELVRLAAREARCLDDVQVARALPRDVLRVLEREAPTTLTVPSGRSVPLEYGADGGVAAAVRLQDLFGLADTPRLGPARVAVLLSLLAPNGRPVQLTRDLRSFWDRTYPEVRKELRGRYPRHSWPEDPWKAKPGGRPNRR
ncbi:MAG: ATP-dependent helicase C-terminal domain-containing protein [Acidobacteriota bacterium]